MPHGPATYKVLINKGFISLTKSASTRVHTTDPDATAETAQDYRVELTGHPEQGVPAGPGRVSL